MAENDTKDCPYCAEPVKGPASICPHCRSSLGNPSGPDTYRNHAGRQIAGVSIALAEGFGVSVTFVRLGFIVATFISFIGPPLYLALWLLLPAEPGGLSPLGRVVTGDNGGPSILERAIHGTTDVFDKVAAWFRGETRTNGHNGDEEPTERTS